MQTHVGVHLYITIRFPASPRFCGEILINVIMVGLVNKFMCVNLFKYMYLNVEGIVHLKITKSYIQLYLCIIFVYRLR